MKKLILSLILCLIITATAFAEQKFQQVSPGGKKYTLVLMSQTEFDAFILKASRGKQDNAFLRRHGWGGEVLGITLTHKKRVALWDDPSFWYNNFGTGKTRGYAWEVYLPVDSRGRYDRESLRHEIQYHVDGDERHPL